MKGRNTMKKVNITKAGSESSRGKITNIRKKASAANGPKVPEKRKSVVAKHKKTLENLAETDPEFYEFLKEQDKEIFDFDLSEDDENEDDLEDDENEKDVDDEDDEEDGEDEISDKDPVPFSDEEEEEGPAPELEEYDEFVAGKVRVTTELTDQWREQLFEFLEDPRISDLRNVSDVLNRVVDAFRAVVIHTGAEADAQSRYQIDDDEGFNSVIRLCFAIFPAVWQKTCSSGVFDLGQKKRKSMRPYTKPYLQNLAAFLEGIQNAQVLNAVLKHLSRIVDFYSLFGTLSRTIMKILVKTWSTQEEDCRLLAFICISKLTRSSPDILVPVALKKMYLAYVHNTKSVTPSTWPLINLMQASYADICNVYAQQTYQFAFVYIRQLAIHLRNAVITKKKDQVKAVYNWQFIQCLYLWARVLGQHGGDGALRPLIYPLIQIALGCVRLIPTAKYIPLRFHCVRSMLTLVKSVGIYVPLLPMALEVFQLFDMNKKHQRQSLKPFDFDCMLKLAESQLQESALKPAVVEGALELIVEIMNLHAGSTAFPEMAFLCCSRLNSFHKSCRIPSLARPAKELSSKLTEHASWMEKRRTEAQLNLTNAEEEVREFEKGNASDTESPMKKYYEIFKKMKDRERKLKVQTEVEPAMKDPPVLERKTRKRKEEQQEKKKVKRQRKSHPVKVEEAANEDADEVRDLNLSDLDE